MQEDGAVRYCGECAWEDPNNPEVPPPPHEREEPAMEPAKIPVFGTKQLGEMCRSRIAELEREVAEAEKRHRERVAGAKDEIAKLRKIAGFCGAGLTPISTGKVGGGAWKCPNCGEQRHGRSISIHKAECTATAVAS